MMNKANWNERFIEIADTIARWSKDTSRGVGAVIADENNSPLSWGFNGFPRNADDDIEERYERPVKYDWTEHAERNAIFNAAKKGITLEGSIIYLRWYPCNDCARAIIQSGIKKVICDKPDFNDERWGDKFLTSHQMFKECGVEVEYLEGIRPPMPYRLGDKVLYPGVDRAPFIVKGIMEDELLIEGDWSGGTHNVCQTGWAPIDDLKPYKDR
jgi:dCMP deaminase